ncbi:TQO small subunit DoxD [Faecalibacter sp. LW9]|uniref:TQO small subunit DoxD n=1 Tax=Faecalibacter sp. LW9 TaxID=3103144 RepID=UPI002AFE30A3|nr:TQO small subunit DoxD [Faecalibacter sp. LW9]
MKNLNQHYQSAGLFTLAIRLVIGWTYFSAFWRRLILDNKLIPNEAGYIGEKFNHFLPHALGIKPLIEHLVLHPDQLQFAMVSFTIVEAIVGLFIILGLFTRLMSIGIFGLAMGILLGSGWIGTTCLDEWQIGVLGIASGFALFLTGSGYYSLDHYFLNKNPQLIDSKAFKWLGSGLLPEIITKRVVLVGALFIFGLTLYTNQYFHGGVYGTLHNKSVKPKVELSNVVLTSSAVTFEVYRTEGADVYGSFLIGIQLLDEKNQILEERNGVDLAQFPLKNIHNHYVAKIKPGKHSLIIPLGAKADLTVNSNKAKLVKTIRLIDISGIVWEHQINH